MALVFEQFLTEEMGDASYLVGDDSSRLAAVVDPQVDVERYLERARSHGLAIRYVIQTHIHEDFLSGAVALRAAAGGSAEVCASGHDAPDYGYPHRLVRDGDRLDLGSVVLTVRHTPGHTPEHISLLVAKTGQEQSPFAVLSGGALLANAAGRTDLLGDEQVDRLTHAQFATLREFFLQLDDGVTVYPTHVHGSPCGAAIGDRISTTIGYERRHNPLLQPKDEASFREVALQDLPPKPRYYPRLKERNTRAQPSGSSPGPVPSLPPDEFRREIEKGESTIVDVRSMLAFGGGHIPGALNIGAAGHPGIWAGWMLDPDRPILLVLDSDSSLPGVLTKFMRTGFERFSGYLCGGMTAWASAALPLQVLRQIHVEELHRRHESEDLTVLDVRAPQEWDKGHIPGAHHVFLPDLPARLDELDRSRPIAVHCASGYRASIGASLLQSRGFDVANVPGSWKAWKAASLPVEEA